MPSYAKNTPKNPNLLNTNQAAFELGVSPKTLSFWRCTDKGPAFIKLGGLVLYRRTDLAAYVAANRFDPAGIQIASK